MNDTATRTAITINIVYLARLREAFASAGERLKIAQDTPPTVASVLKTLAARGGAFATELAPGRAVRVAVNHVLASSETPLRDGDEVALLPPVTGG